MWTHVATLRFMGTIGLRELKNSLSEVVRREDVQAWSEGFLTALRQATSYEQ